MKGLVSTILIIQALSLQAQVNVTSQLWNDFNVVYPFANIWTADAEFSYQTLISGGEKWRSYQLTPGIQRNMSQRIDLFLSTPFYYTTQTLDYVTLEARVSPAVRFIYTANRRIESRSVLRYDFRTLKTTGGDWQVANRSRLSLEFIAALNKPNIYQDKLLYLLLDGEWFFVIDQNAEERFATLRKGRLGLGYRLSYKHRFELIYQVHKSKTTIDQPYDNRDNIFRLRYVMVLNPPRDTNKAPMIDD